MLSVNDDMGTHYHNVHYIYIHYGADYVLVAFMKMWLAIYEEDPGTRIFIASANFMWLH